MTICDSHGHAFAYSRHALPTATASRLFATSCTRTAHALNGDGYQAVMAKASLRIKGYLSSTAMRLPNIGPDADQLAKAEEGMKAAGLL